MTSLDDRLANLARRDVSRVLRRDDDGVDGDRLLVLVHHRDLRLAVRAQPLDVAAAAAIGERLGEPMREQDRHRHELVGLVGRVAEHHPLVARAAGVDAHRDVRRLTVDRADHGAGLAVEAVAGIGVADALDRARTMSGMWTYVFVVISPATQARPVVTSVSHATRAVGIVGENGVEHGVGDRVRDLVGMALGDGFGREEMAIVHGRFRRVER